MKTQRESGYYWAFYFDDWIIVEYIKETDSYFIPGNEQDYYAEEFKLIGTTNIVNPNK